MDTFIQFFVWRQWQKLHKMYTRQKNCPIDDDEGLRFITFRVHHMTMIKSKETCTPINNSNKNIAEQHQNVNFFIFYPSIFFSSYTTRTLMMTKVLDACTHIVWCVLKRFFWTIAMKYIGRGVILSFLRFYVLK